MVHVSRCWSWCCCWHPHRLCVCRRGPLNCCVHLPLSLPPSLAACKYVRSLDDTWQVHDAMGALQQEGGSGAAHGGEADPPPVATSTQESSTATVAELSGDGARCRTARCAVLWGVVLCCAALSRADQCASVLCRAVLCRAELTKLPVCRCAARPTPLWCCRLRPLAWP